MSEDPGDRAYSLLGQGQIEEALRISTRLVSGGAASHGALVLHATALNAAHRHDEALAANHEALRLFPASSIAWHNLATTLVDLGRGGEALEALAKGFALGLDSPVSYQMKARAHVAVGEVPEAEAAYREALERAPNFPDLAVEQADFIWMAHGDLAEAVAGLDRAFHAGAPPAPLLLAKAKLLASADRKDDAATLLANATVGLPGELPLLVAGAQAALEAGRHADADRLARAAMARAPHDVAVLVQATIVALALGDLDRACASIKDALARAPLDQSVLAWAATSWRAAGELAYRQLYDFDQMVGVYDVPTPPGWASQKAFLRDLAAALDRHHVMKEHPSAQSLRHGTQTTYLLTGSQEPAIQAFFAAIDKPVREHIEALGRGPDPLRCRNNGTYAIAGAWSVRLRSGGFHLDHMHHQGWLSSAFYVETPDGALDSEDKEGWLRLGHPPYPTKPPQPAERFVRPKPGRLVLFPSYMWHGTVPFSTDERRTTIAFDLVPGVQLER